MLQNKTRSWSTLPLFLQLHRNCYWWTAHLHWRSLFYIDVGGRMLYSQCQCLLPAYRTLVTAWSALWTGQLEGGWHCWKRTDGLTLWVTMSTSINVHFVVLDRQSHLTDPLKIGLLRIYIISVQPGWGVESSLSYFKLLLVMNMQLKNLLMTGMPTHKWLHL